MKCNYCGAEISNNSKFCEFCGGQVSLEVRREQEQLNKAGCPRCGSTNISFSREKQGEIKGKNSVNVVRVTVGLCRDCGHTCNTAGHIKENTVKNNMIWWVLGWILFFPAPVMILIWREKSKLSLKVKIGLTVAFWIVVLVIGAFSNSDESEPKNNTSTESAYTYKEQAHSIVL